MLAIVKRRDIKSLRDLCASHLPLLKGIRNAVSTKVSLKYGIPPEKLCVFVHYFPTYFHFHVHILNLESEAAGINVGQAHLLDEIIDNIESIDGEYYKRRTLFYILGSDHGLYHQIY